MKRPPFCQQITGRQSANTRAGVAVIISAALDDGHLIKVFDREEGGAVGRIKELRALRSQLPEQDGKTSLRVRVEIDFRFSMAISALPLNVLA